MRLRKFSDAEVLSLRDEGKNRSEIARSLHVSVPAVSKRLKRLLTPALPALTGKQLAFCRNVASGKSQTQSCVEAYDVQDRKSAKAMGTVLMEQPKVKETIEQLMNNAGLTRSRRVEVLAKHVENVQDPQTSLKALDMSFKLGNDYPPTKTISLNLTADLGSVDYREFMREYELPAEDEDNT